MKNIYFDISKAVHSALSRVLRSIAFVSILLSPSTGWSIDYNFSGFGTIAAGKVNKDKTLFLDYDDSWSFDSDTVLGLQLVTEFNESLSLYTQVVSRGDSNRQYDDYDPRIRWFFLKAEIGTRWQARVGRLQLPLYTISDHFDVGYSYPWVRPPIDTYPIAGYTVGLFDGADAIYTRDYDNFISKIEFYGGSLRSKADSFQTNIKRLIGLSATIETQSITLRYNITNIVGEIKNEDLKPVTTLFKNSGSESEFYPRLADELKVDDETFIYHALDIAWDLQKAQFQFSYHATESPHDLAIDTEGFMLSISAPFNIFTPYAVVGKSRFDIGDDTIKSINKSFESDAPRGQNQILDLSRDGLTEELKFVTYQQTSLTLGVRIDIYDQVALKFEAQKIKPESGEQGQFVPPKGETGNDLTVFTVALDFVF